ncbi:GNAT family N-acetyltransferase [Flavobacterium sp. JP2137]|uniref:GNAT family N-acetyltransferase n=1 Tax=Flavobacterium sp. JP2137 TaxID=3414510 RepID=UPI003D2FAD3F
MPYTGLIRPYQPKDQAAIIDLFTMNTPLYFSADERIDLIDYLNHHIEHYFVVEIAGEIVGSGGINFSENNSIGKLSWDLFHPDYQGKGLGTQLTQFRIEFLQNIDHIQTISVRTSQVAYLFYQKMGFVLRETVADYWSAGFDLYHMDLVTDEKKLK